MNGVTGAAFGGLAWIGLGVALALLVAGAFWSVRFLVRPMRDLRIGRRTPRATALLAGGITVAAMALAGAFVAASRQGVSTLDRLLRRRVGSTAHVAGHGHLLPERLVFTSYVLLVAVLLYLAVSRDR